jgi:antitoxin component YwqK of YwqJK toxin-antitoxin module
VLAKLAFFSANLNDMRNFILFFLAIFTLSACSKLETIENKNDAGILLEKYSRRKDTFAKEGPYQAFHPNGKIFEESRYVNDTLHGERKLYYESGALQSIEHLEHGRYAGPFLKYYENGQLSNEGQYVDNEMSGIWKRYFDTGELMEEVNFSKNEENGPFKIYHKNGKISVEGVYENGENEQGELKKYDENGELIAKMFCHYGACATTWSKETGETQIDTARIKELGEIRRNSEEF